MSGFYREELAPRVQHGEERLGRLQEISQSIDSEGFVSEFCDDRVKKLAQWHRKAVALFPLIETLFEE